MANCILYLKNESEFPIESDEVSNLPDRDFEEVEVISGQWILYGRTDYNENQKGDAAIQIVRAGERKQLRFMPKSCREVKTGHDAIVLFKHINYGGKQKIYMDANSDINPDFPAGEIAGASSCIVHENSSWNLYEGIGYKPPVTNVSPEAASKDGEGNGWYRSFVDLDINERIQSIRQA